MSQEIKISINQARAELMRLDQTVRDVSDALCELDTGSGSEVIDRLRAALAEANVNIRTELNKLNPDT